MRGKGWWLAGPHEPWRRKRQNGGRRIGAAASARAGGATLC